MAQRPSATRRIISDLVEIAPDVEPQHICRITAFCCDKTRYLAARSELGAIWRQRMGRHYPAMSMIFVADLLDHPAVIELEATAVLPHR